MMKSNYRFDVICLTALKYLSVMLDFCLIRFPIFNVADSALTIGCIMLIVDALFLKERSLFELKLRRRTDGETGDRDDG